jgi:tRNA 5-methylaminomethyl-2-thiouridine biosynthesis bifunctional protein
MPPLLVPAMLSFNADGLPVSQAYGDVYHAAAGAHAQARHVFLAGNGLPQRWQEREHFVVLETGFGLGLNFLATWLAWRDDARRCPRVHFVSLEKHPFCAADLARAHAAWPELASLAAELRRCWPPLAAGTHTLAFDGGGVQLTLHFGDARQTLPDLELAVDAFYLDGFSPAKNPELWSPELCQALARLAAPRATLATWSVAGSVRRALSAAGFTVCRRPGFAGKRQMLSGCYARDEKDDHAEAAETVPSCL